MRIHVDKSQLENLELDLSRAPARIRREVPAILRQSIGPKLHREVKRDARGHRFLRHLPSAATWEMLDDWGVEAGLQPRPAGTQGRLAHIIVHGSINNAPVYDHTAALRRTLPFAEQKLADAAERSVLGDS